MLEEHGIYIWSALTALRLHAPFSQWVRGWQRSPGERGSHSLTRPLLRLPDSDVHGYLSGQETDLCSDWLSRWLLGRSAGQRYQRYLATPFPRPAESPWKQRRRHRPAGLNSILFCCWPDLDKLPIMLRDFFLAFCTGHVKFSGVICICICYLIWADGGLTLSLILLHHNVGTCGGCEVTVLLRSVILDGH